MSDISRTTALEIFTHPDDLSFILTQDEESERFAFGIFRGPGHQGKALITTEPFTKNKEKALGVIKELLERICNIYEGSRGPDVLGKELINQVIKELQEKGTASTRLMLEKKA